MFIPLTCCSLACLQRFDSVLIDSSTDHCTAPDSLLTQDKAGLNGKVPRIADGSDAKRTDPQVYLLSCSGQGMFSLQLPTASLFAAADDEGTGSADEGTWRSDEGTGSADEGTWDAQDSQHIQVEAAPSGPVVSSKRGPWKTGLGVVCAC